MNGAHPDDDRADELTKRYRAASAADPARPGHAVRDSILAYARTVAADRATHGMARAPRRRPAASDFGWRISAAASVIVAGLATLLAWHSHAPTRVAEREPNSLSPQVAAHDPTTQLDRPADTAPAPNAVTTRSRQRADARAEAPPRAYDKDPGTEGGSVASSLQAPARLGAGAAGGNAASGESAMDAERRLENPTAGAQFAPSGAAPPPSVRAPRSQALEAAASARASVASNAALVMAAESGNLELVDQLLHSGVGTEQTDAHGRTALLVATLHGDMTMARRLLAAGARVDAVDAAGDTPLTVARRQGPPELAQLLERASHP
jgi:cytoskeletal protein RodZ